MISVIMASTLADYKNAAKHRDKKILRAINSLYNQIDNDGNTFTDFELVVVSDGCEKTVKLTKPLANTIIRVEKCPIWSGKPRNTGIEYARGDIIVYLDNDDAFAPFHLQHIKNNFGGDSLLFGDMVPMEKSFRFEPFLDYRRFNFRGVTQKLGFCGTSNIAHTPKYRWPEKSDYAHDWVFIKQFKDIKTIERGGYMVCHVPGMYDI